MRHLKMSRKNNMEMKEFRNECGKEYELRFNAFLKLI